MSDFNVCFDRMQLLSCGNVWTRHKGAALLRAARMKTLAIKRYSSARLRLAKPRGIMKQPIDFGPLNRCARSIHSLRELANSGQIYMSGNVGGLTRSTQYVAQTHIRSNRLLKAPAGLDGRNIAPRYYMEPSSSISTSITRQRLDQ